MKALSKNLSCLLLSLLLAACGGGGGGGGASTNAAPVFTSPASASVTENQGLVAYNATATDQNNDALTYSISGGADRAAFAMDASTGELSFLVAPDFDAPADADIDNSYEVVISVRDARGSSDTLSLSISVDDDPSDNGNPVFTSAASITAPENESDLGYLATAEDPDGAVASIEISGGLDQSQFVLDPQDYSLTFDGPKDFEAPTDSNADNQYHVELLATDDEGKQATLLLTVSVTNVDQPRAEFLFPTPGANVGVGRNTEITVSVRLVDDEDGITDIDFVTVNGFHLAPNTADPDLWAGRVPLTPDENVLDLMAESEDGFAASAERTIDNVLPVAGHIALAIDDAGQNFFMSHAMFGALQRINLATGELHVFPTAEIPTDFVLSADGIRTFILHPGLKRIYKLDAATGLDELIYQDGSATVTSLNEPRRIEVDELNDRLIVLDIAGTGLNEIDRLIAVDIATGETGIVSDETTGSGPQLTYPRNLALDPALNVVYVVNSDLTLNTDELIAVDLADGTRSVVASESVGIGAMPQAPSAVVLDAPSGLAYVADSVGAITTIDVNTGSKTLLADRVMDHLNQGSELDLALDSANQRLLLTDPDRNKIWSIDTQTGARDIFYDTPTGTGPGMESTHSLYFDEALDRLLVVNQNHALIAVDLTSGNRTVLAADGVGSGPTDFGTGIAPDLPNDRVFVPGFNSILEIDLVTGNRAEVSGPNVGFGLAFQFVRNPIFDASGNRILVIEGFPDKRITAVDLASGERSIFSDQNTGSGPNLNSPLDMTLDETRNRILVTQNTGPLLAIDLASGNRSVFSGDGVGSGQNISTSLGIALDQTGDRAFVSSLGQVYTIDLATGDRVWLSVPGSAGIRAEMESLAWDTDRNLLYSPNAGIGAILAMELESGDIVISSK